MSFEQEMNRDLFIGILFIVLVCVGGFFIIKYLSDQDELQNKKDKISCEKSGGKWLIDHYETTGSVTLGAGTIVTYPVYNCKQEKNK